MSSLRNVLLGVVPRRFAVPLAERLPAVELCRRVFYDGFEHVHAAAARGTVVLLVSGGARLLPRILALFPPVRGALTVRVASPDDAAAAARRARDGAAVATGLVCAPKGRFCVRFLPPVVAAEGETEEALAGRCLAALREVEGDA